MTIMVVVLFDSVHCHAYMTSQISSQISEKLQLCMTHGQQSILGVSDQLRRRRSPIA